MRFDAFIGGSYQAQAVTADQEKTVNWYPELLQSPGASAKAVLYPTPGVQVVGSVTAKGNGRAHFAMNGREFAVVGGTFYEIDSVGTPISRGSVAVNADPATISSNGDGGGQLFITSGRNGYIFDLTTNILNQITALNGKASMGDHLDGYFMALDANTATLYTSKLLDGLTWETGLDFAQRSIAPDRWLAVKVVGRFVWLFGESTSEVWYDTGARFPFAPHPSGLLQFGIAAPHSAAIIGSDIIWLGSTRAGKLCVLQAQGFTPSVISTYPLESKIHEYSSVSSAVADVYSDRGHTFYLVSFDKDGVTWAYDAETRLWSERGTWISDENKFVSWRPRFYAFAFGQHRMLDSGGGSIYELNSDYSTDVDGLPIRRLRRAPAILSENQRVFYSHFELDLEPGIGKRRPSQASFSMAAVAVESIYFEWLQGSESAQVTFGWTLSSHYLGTDGNVTATWDFGDGGTAVNTYTSANVGLITVNHTYTYPPNATFTVSLTVTSDTHVLQNDASMTTNYALGQTGSTS